MNTFTRSLALCAAALCPLTLAAQDVPRQSLARIRAVSVSIEVNGAVAGSGTLFDKDGETYCVTARHVVHGAKGNMVRVIQVQPTRVIAVHAPILRADEANDVALLQIGKGVFAPGATLHKAKLDLDTPLVHCGTMHGHHHTVTRGYLIGHQQQFKPGVPRDLVDLTGTFGSSGGGVFDIQGCYVGMVVGGVGMRLVYIVPASALVPLLE